jgi:hypothetical protein
VQVKTVVLVVISNDDPVADGRPLRGFAPPYVRIEVWKPGCSSAQSTVVVHAGLDGPIPSLQLTLKDVFWRVELLPVAALELDRPVLIPLSEFVAILVQTYRFKKSLPPITRFEEPDVGDLEEPCIPMPETALERAARQ